MRNYSKLIGNDIVDLQAAEAESNWRRKGFLAKTFTVEEQQLISAAVQPDQLVWMLWSMKEAAYKIDTADTGIRSFTPLKLHCQLSSWANDTALGTVTVAERQYHTRSMVSKKLVYTHCAADKAQLQHLKSRIYLVAQHPDFDYHATAPDCVSHHGAYLALVYLH